MKSTEDGSGFSFDSAVASALASRSDLSLRSSYVVSFTPVYIHAGRTCSWRGTMCFDK
jgi:hypothetical protein